jgi:hypothetical protein
LIECNGLEEAALYQERCEKIADYYQLAPLQGKLILLKCSLEYKKKAGQFKTIEEIEGHIRRLEQVTKIF